MTARGDGAARCSHCERPIEWIGNPPRGRSGIWIDPEATGDDSIWRETCDAHDTFEAKHEPEPDGIATPLDGWELIASRESYNESMDRLGWTRTGLPS